ncbi:MAG: hypothetical protein Q9166_000155 [cf. Caloplaca sp. 2 TL-2023]
MDLIDPNIRKDYEEQATPNGSLDKKEICFKFRLDMDAEELWKAGNTLHDVKGGETGQSSIHRAPFLDELIALVPKRWWALGSNSSA